MSGYKVIFIIYLVIFISSSIRSLHYFQAVKHTNVSNRFKTSTVVFAKNISPIVADEIIKMCSDKTSPDICHWKWSKTYRINNMSVLFYNLTNLRISYTPGLKQQNKKKKLFSQNIKIIYVVLCGSSSWHRNSFDLLGDGPGSVGVSCGVWHWDTGSGSVGSCGLQRGASIDQGCSGVSFGCPTG